MATEDTIPVIDFKDVLSSSDLSSCSAVQELHSVFTTVGFAFIKNHGIKQELIDKLNSVAMEFFNKPLETKMKYLYHHYGEKDTKRNGYICLCQQGNRASGGGDMHEAFEACSIKDCKFPNEEVPEFQDTVTQFHKEAVKLARTILELLGHALIPQNPLFFVKRHIKIGQGMDYNFSAARVIRYPPIPPSLDFKQFLVSDEDKVFLRKHEHVDHGSLTLLFADPNIGGLQVKKVNNSGWIDAKCPPGAVVVNLGLMMEQWTGGMYLATPHRVIVLNDETSRQYSRQCTTLFVHPDADTLIESIDGPNKHAPFRAGEEIRRRIGEIFNADYDK